MDAAPAAALPLPARVAVPGVDAHYTACDGHLHGSHCAYSCLANFSILALGDEAQCLLWWYNHQQRHVNCPTCRQRYAVQVYQGQGVLVSRLYCRMCRTTRGMHDGTRFAGLRTSPRLILAYLGLFCAGVAVVQIRNMLGLGRDAVASLNAVLFDATTAANFKEYLSLGRHEDADYAALPDGFSRALRVQADESAIGARKYHRGARRRKDGTIWMAGFVEVDNAGVRRMIAHVVANRTRDELMPLLEPFDEEGFVVTTDAWRAYRLDRAEHRVVNHSEGFRNSAGDTTNAIEGMWRHLKGHISRRFGRVGAHYLRDTNDRVQMAVFFVNCSLNRRHPMRELFHELDAHVANAAMLATVRAIQQELQRCDVEQLHAEHERLRRAAEQAAEGGESEDEDRAAAAPAAAAAAGEHQHDEDDDDDDEGHAGAAPAAAAAAARAAAREPSVLARGSSSSPASSQTLNVGPRQVNAFFLPPEQIHAAGDAVVGAAAAAAAAPKSEPQKRSRAREHPPSEYVGMTLYRRGVAYAIISASARKLLARKEEDGPDGEVKKFWLRDFDDESSDDDDDDDDDDVQK